MVHGVYIIRLSAILVMTKCNYYFPLVKLVFKLFIVNIQQVDGMSLFSLQITPSFHKMQYLQSD